MCSSRDAAGERQRRRGSSGGGGDGAPSAAADQQPDCPKSTKVFLLLAFLVVDIICSTLLLIPWSFLKRIEDETSHFTLYGSLVDLFVLSALRITAALYALLRSYLQNSSRPETPFDPLHPTGEKKSREELEEEALEEPCGPFLRRYVSRFAFPCELFSLLCGLLLIVKCFARLNVEIGVFDDAEQWHPLFWVALCVVALACVVEVITMEPVGKVAGAVGRYRRRNNTRRSIISRLSSSNLLAPLLSSNNDDGTDEQQSPDTDEEMAADEQEDVEDIRGESDISGDSNYSAGWTDLLGVCAPDTHLILMAFLFLLCAATAQIYVPHYTGKVLDALAEANSGDDGGGGDNDDDSGGNVWKIPGFVSNVTKLIVASILGGIFSGLRGSVFTVVGGRVNVRLRVLLMDSLLTQDIGFFDCTKTGHISSRLTSDTTLVGDQVTLNVNVFLRSLVQAIGVLIFMFFISWQLSLLAFISVPLITVLSKWYGQYIRSLTKLMQKKLADGNSVSEAALGSMSTVRAFGAESSELKEFSVHCERYLTLNRKAAFAYLGYATCVTSLPQLVIAVVLFYGGLLVHSDGPDHISSGQLVTFLLYLTSLSDAFNSIGSIFASLTQAVGAADKVFELIHRKPRIERPSLIENGQDYREPPPVAVVAGNLSAYGIQPRNISQHRNQGLHPDSNCNGQITLSGVDMYYPARPQRKILDDLTLEAPPGKVVALVGASGGGKSSIVSLVQHLYEPRKGEVMIDDRKVQDFSYEWLSRNISIVSQEPTLFARSIHRNIIYGTSYIV